MSLEKSLHALKSFSGFFNDIGAVYEIVELVECSMLSPRLDGIKISPNNLEKVQQRGKYKVTGSCNPNLVSSAEHVTHQVECRQEYCIPSKQAQAFFLCNTVDHAGL